MLAHVYGVATAATGDCGTEQTCLLGVDAIHTVTKAELLQLQVAARLQQLPHNAVWLRQVALQQQDTATILEDSSASTLIPGSCCQASGEMHQHSCSPGPVNMQAHSQLYPHQLSPSPTPVQQILSSCVAKVWMQVVYKAAQARWGQ